MDPILSALPSIHVTLIGIFGAFVCGFGIYVLQKIHEVADARSKLVKECSVLVSSVHMGGGEKFINDKGELNWGLANKCVKDCGYFNFDHNSPSGLKEQFESLMSLMGVVFSVYPFFSTHMDSSESINDVVKSRRNADIDSERLKDLEGRVAQLYGRFERFEPEFTKLAVKYSQLENESHETSRSESLEASLRSIPFLDKEQEAKIRQRHALSGMNLSVDYSGIVSSSIAALEGYRRVVIPRCKDLALEYDKWRGRFASRRMSVFMFFSLFFILLFGVFVPPVILWGRESFNACLAYSICWNRWYSVILLTSTAAPYFIVGGWYSYVYFFKRRV
jgi:hypothetical protein